MPKSENRVKALALLVLFLAAGLYLLMQKDELAAAWSNWRRASETAVFTETGVKLSYNYDSAASFYACGDENFFYCTKDGLKYMNAKGEALWEDVFTMTAPVMLGEGQYLIVAEPKGNVIYVYGTSGRLYTKQFDGAVMDFTVNSAGYAAVTVKVEQDYETRIFTAEGSELPKFVHQDSNIFPIRTEVSGDGRVAVTSLLDINGLSMTSHIIARYLGSEASAHTDGIFASRLRENQIVAVLKFMKEDNLFGFSDTGAFHAVINDENPLESLQDIELGNKIDQMGFFGREGFVLALGGAFTNEDGLPEGTLKFYNTRGEEIGAYELGRKAAYMSCSRGNAIVGAGRAFYAFNAKGKLLWRYDATADFRTAISLGNSDTVLFATNTEAVIMKRGK